MKKSLLNNRMSRWSSVVGVVVVALALSFCSQAAPAADVDARAELRATQEAFHRVATTLRPCLVRIETVGGAQPTSPIATEDEETNENPQQKRLQNPFRDTAGSDFALADGPTTGIVWSSDGHIVTSSFNFVRDPMLITVTLSDGRRLRADLVARDQVHKVALLRVEADGLPVPTWASESELRVGQWAIALGMAFSDREPFVTAGIVSALKRMRGSAVQTDAKLSPANYGGPLCDLSGRIIGLCTPMAQRHGELAGVEMYDSGVGFALGKERLDAIVARLMTGQSVYRGWLGLSLDTRFRNGLVITNIADPSPARAAGVRPGDRIMEINGVPMKHYGLLVRETYMLPAGESVRMKIGRYPDPPPEDDAAADGEGEAQASADMIEFEVTVRLARNTELGPLPEIEEPFDPSQPFEED
jgi:serine protease Do